MERGIRRLAIFQDEMDFEVFLEILKKEAMEKECKIHAYCLMTNHFHLNPVKDKRIVELNDIVEEVKESEEWEAVKMNILEIGIEKGIEQGL